MTVHRWCQSLLERSAHCLRASHVVWWWETPQGYSLKVMDSKPRKKLLKLLEYPIVKIRCSERVARVQKGMGYFHRKMRKNKYVAT